MFDKNAQRVQEVIFFIGEAGVTKEMMYTEFEAVLDGVVGLDEFANTKVYCVFAVIAAGLIPTAFVFFTIDFDENGEPPQLWNVPFQVLIKKSAAVAFGPYTAKVVSRDACSIEWHRDSLWSPSNDVVSQLVEAIQDNQLCLSTEGASTLDQSMSIIPSFASQAPAQFGSPQGLAQQSLPELVQEMAHKLAGAQQSAYFNRGADHDLQHTLKTLTDDLHSMTQRANEMERQNGELRAKFKGVREDRLNERNFLIKEFEAKIKKAVSDTKNRITEKFEKKLKNYENEYKERFSSQVSAIKTSASATHQILAERNELLVEKDALLIEKREKILVQEQLLADKDNLIKAQEISISEQATTIESLEHTVKQLSEELASFRKEKLRLMADGADKFFEKLEQSGLNFIAFHPGAGHLSVSVQQVAAYLNNPISFAAAKLGLSEEAYAYWLNHYERPCCQAPIMGGKTCGLKIQRHENPRDFNPGISDRCDKHRTGFSAAGRVFSS